MLNISIVGSAGSEQTCFLTFKLTDLVSHVCMRRNEYFSFFTYLIIMRASTGALVYIFIVFDNDF